MNYTKNTDDFTRIICDKVYHCYLNSLAKFKVFNIGLTGGSTPKLIYNHLVASYLDKFDWSKVNFFFVDDRCVSMDSPDSNYNLANQMLFRFLPTANVYRFETELPGEEGLKKYRDYLSKETIHCALLGMGEDGHVGSIFPNAHEEYTTESAIITKDEHNGLKRFSLSIDAINQIESNILMINNNHKKEEIIASGSEDYPINRVKNLTIVVKKS